MQSLQLTKSAPEPAMTSLSPQPQTTNVVEMRGSQLELERLTRRYVSRIHRFIGPFRDIPAPDVNTNPRVMAWILDKVNRQLRSYLTRAYRNVRKVAEGRDISLREAAWLIAIDRVARAESLRGAMSARNNED